jgi:hypothetical protein
MTLSSSALGLSVGFLSKSPFAGSCKAILFMSWACFGATVANTIFSYFVTQAGLNWQLRETEEYLTDPARKNYPDARLNPFSRALYVMSWFAAVAFVVGIALTAIHIGSNIDGDEKGAQKNIQENRKEDIKTTGT